MTDNHLTIPILQKIVDACAGLAPTDVLLGTNRADIGRIARQLIATMQQNAKLREALQYAATHGRDSFVQKIAKDALYATDHPTTAQDGQKEQP